MYLSAEFSVSMSYKIVVGIYLLKLKTLGIKEIIDTKENGNKMRKISLTLKAFNYENIYLKFSTSAT